MTRFAKGDSHHVRAQQVWMILVAHIMRDRGGQGDSVAPRCIESALITYEELAGRMGWTVPIAVRWPLGIVGTYCCENDLPSLSSMVVKKRTGKPGKGVILREGRTCRDEQRGVVQTDWFMYRVPTIETFDVTISLMEVTRSIGVPFPGSASFAGGPAHAQSRSRT